MQALKCGRVGCTCCPQDNGCMRDADSVLTLRRKGMPTPSETNRCSECCQILAAGFDTTPDMNATWRLRSAGRDTTAPAVA